MSSLTTDNFIKQDWSVHHNRGIGTGGRSTLRASTYSVAIGVRRSFETTAGVATAIRLTRADGRAQKTCEWMARKIAAAIVRRNEPTANS